MNPARKLGTFMRMSGGDRVLVCEAIVWLGWARLLVLTVPFRLVAAQLSRPSSGGCGDPASLLRVRNAVTTAARNVPWNAVCLPQAMAAKSMLARRGVASSLHLGAGIGADGKLVAHAWLSVGGAGITAVTPLARFG
jgi:hypothetical protein